MTTMNSPLNTRLIPITDDRGRPMVPEDECFEPECGSIVLVKGPQGTAWQRFFDTGLWYSARGKEGRTWEQMLASPGLVLVYEVGPRE